MKIVLHCLMSSADLKSGEEITDVGFLPSLVEEIFEGTDLEELLDLMFERILQNMRISKREKATGDLFGLKN